MDTKDYVKLLNLITANTDSQKHVYQVLGDVESYPIYLFQPKRINPEYKNVLIVSGFHGEEFCGPWGLCKFILAGGLQDLKVNLSFIPVVNPSGFVRQQRYNVWGEVSNYGYLNGHLSHEGKILVQNNQLLIVLARDGFLSLHENAWQKDFFLYILSKQSDSKLTEGLLKTGSKFFKILPDGKYHTDPEGDYTVKGGLVRNVLDGTFDHYLQTLGIPICITTEVPAQGMIGPRIGAHQTLIQNFLSFFGTEIRA